MIIMLYKLTFLFTLSVCLCVSAIEMSCLMSAMEDTSIHLHDDCSRQLRHRIELWNAAVKVIPAVSFVTSNISTPT